MALGTGRLNLKMSVAQVGEKYGEQAECRKQGAR